MAMMMVLLWRIHDEEALMRAEFGTAWEAYSRKSWRLVPFGLLNYLGRVIGEDFFLKLLSLPFLLTFHIHPAIGQRMRQQYISQPVDSILHKAYIRVKKTSDMNLAKPKQHRNSGGSYEG